MDAQDFRSLQEAYMEVVENQQLDEAQVPDTQRRADRIMKQSVKLHTTAIEKGQPKKHRKAAIVAGTSRRMSQRAKERDQEAERQEFNVKEDIYDIILSHLLDEGYAETPEAAEVIMVNMSEDWRESIVEEMLDEALTGDRYKKALKKGKMYSRMVSKDPSKRATRGGRGDESDFGAGDRGSGNKAARRAGTYRED